MTDDIGASDQDSAEESLPPVSAENSLPWGSPSRAARLAGAASGGNSQRAPGVQSAYLSTEEPASEAAAGSTLGSGSTLGGDSSDARSTADHAQGSQDSAVDDFGFDAAFTDSVVLELLRPLYRNWFRVSVSGIDAIPAEGAALVVANHSGTIAFDALMTQVAVHDEHPANRHLRMLGADFVFDTPFLGTLARRAGHTLACHEDAEKLLTSGEVVGVWPEGVKGIGKPFASRYRLQRFGRGGFVSAAVRTGAPIIPTAIVGAEEIYPMMANASGVGRALGLPYFPITPTFPALGPLGLIPLPSKWLIHFDDPIETSSLPDGAADDPNVLFDITDQVRERIQRKIYDLLEARSSAFG